MLIAAELSMQRVRVCVMCGAYCTGCRSSTVRQGTILPTHSAMSPSTDCDTVSVLADAAHRSGAAVVSVEVERCNTAKMAERFALVDRV